MRKRESKTSTSDKRTQEPIRQAMPPMKLRTAPETTHQLDADTATEDYGNCIIQGLPVQLVRGFSETVFSYSPSFRPGEISESQFFGAYGSEDPDFSFSLMTQLANVWPQSKSLDVDGFKFALATVKGMAPRDVLEAMNLVQLAVVHAYSMMYMERLSRATPYALDMARQAQSQNRLVRTHCTLTAAFDRHRTISDRNCTRRQAIRVAGQRLQDPDFVSGLFGPLAHIGARFGFVVDDSLAFGRTAVKAMAPQDPLEAQICAQMARDHVGFMMFAHRLGRAEDSAEMESAERSLNGFSRAFCGLMGRFDHHRYVASRPIAVRQANSKPEAIVRSVNRNGIKMNGKGNAHASA